MGIFDIEVDGRTFEVEAPDMQTAVAAIRGPATQPQKGTTAPMEPRSRLTRARDVFTGELRTEFPDALEFETALMRGRVRPEDLPNMGEFDLTSVARSGVTPDPKAQLDILRRNIPGLEDRTDAFGNVMLRAPRFGVTDWTYLNKPGASARDVDEFATGTLATLPFMGLFGRGGSIAARAATGAAAGAGSSVTQDALAMAQGSEQGIDAGRAGMSAAFSAALGPLTGRARPAPTPTPRDELLEAAGRVNVPVPRAVASDSDAVRRLAGGVGEVPILGTPIPKSVNRGVEAIGEAAETTARGYGSASGPLNAGEAAAQGMMAWIKGGSQAVDRRLYDRVDRLVNPNITRQLAETRTEVQSLIREMQVSGGDAHRRAIELVSDAIGRPAGLNYEGLKRLRTEIGARISGDIVPEAGTSMEALKRLYGALTVDLGVLIGSAGGQRASQAFNLANSVHRQIAERRQDLARIVGAQGDVAPERVFERLLTMAQSRNGADFGRLEQARKAMGQAAWGEVASAAVARMGRDTQGAFSPQRFITAYGKMSDNGKNALFGRSRGAGLRQALDDIQTVSERFAQLQRMGNPSGTGRVVSVGGLGTAAAGMFVSPMAALTPLIGTSAVALALSRPATAKAVSRWANAYLTAATSNTQGAMAVLTQASRQLAEALDGEEGASPRPQTFEQALKLQKGTRFTDPNGVERVR